jgi:hypothetical protein
VRLGEMSWKEAEEDLKMRFMVEGNFIRCLVH